MCECEQKAYRRFSTGYTFADIRQMLWSYSDDPKDWKNVTRHTVLGRWRELKLEMWYKLGKPGYEGCNGC